MPRFCETNGLPGFSPATTKKKIGLPVEGRREPHAPVIDFGFNFGALLNAQLTVVLESEFEEDENLKLVSQKEKKRDNRRRKD